MHDISRIRALIAEQKSDAEIAAQLQAEDRDADNLGWDNPFRTFRCLALTMHRAVAEDRAVSAKEVMVQLELFRRFWEEIVACGDTARVEKVVLQKLSVVAPAPKTSTAYMHLHADMSLLSTAKQALPAVHQGAREKAEGRYLRQVGRHPVICCARAASAVADASDILMQVLGSQAHYRDLFTPEVLQPCAILLMTHHPTWAELLAEVAAPAGSK